MGLSFEAGQAILVCGEGVWQDFQRDVAVQLRVPGPIHLTHPAAADEGGDLVSTQARAGGKGHAIKER